MFPSEKDQPGFEQSEELALFPIDLLSGTRGYLEKILEQVNGTYLQGYYDACSVMLRRLIETLLIECFEQHGHLNEISNADGNFVPLEKLISIFLSSSHWSIGRNSKKAIKELPSLKSMGDVSAHNRRYNARKDDVDRIRFNARVSIEELVAIAFRKRGA